MTIHINLLETALTIIALYCVVMPIVMYRGEIKRFLKSGTKSPPEIITQETIERAKPEDIMGKSSPVRSHKLHESATSYMAESKLIETPKKENTFDPSKEKQSDGVIPNDKLDKFFSNTPEELNIDVDTEEEEPEEISEEDLTGENEEFQKYNVGSEGEYSSGVSFDELGTVNKVITSEKITKSEAVEAAIAIQKIEDTQMYNQLVSSIDGAERKVQAVMDNILYGKKSELLFYEVESADDFDIWKAIK